MTTETLFVTQGCDFETDLQLLNDDSTPINVAAYLFTGVVRKNPYSVLPSANLTINKFDAANGNTMIELSAANTANLEEGTYRYTVLANTGNTTIQLLDGYLIVLPSVTETQPTPQTVVFPQTLPNTTYFNTANSNQYA